MYTSVYVDVLLYITVLKTGGYLRVSLQCILILNMLYILHSRII